VTWRRNSRDAGERATQENNKLDNDGSEGCVDGRDDGEKEQVEEEQETRENKASSGNNSDQCTTSRYRTLENYEVTGVEAAGSGEGGDWQKEKSQVQVPPFSR
jgi:hypothetical protein